MDGQTRLITAANFCQNGKYAVIGTYDGRCIFYDTEVRWRENYTLFLKFEESLFQPMFDDSLSITMAEHNYENEEHRIWFTISKLFLSSAP